MSIASEITRINTNIANAYTQCNNKGATLPQTQNSSNLANTIASIQTGGGGSSIVDEKDVNFYDYDGTRTNSYTKTEFLALESMPSNPNHSGLTSQGWNWSLADAQAYVTTHNKLTIGQMYVPTDGKTKIYIELGSKNLSPYLGFAINGTATVEWGDGTTDTITGSSINTVVYIQHNYSTAGEYVIKISSESYIYFIGTTPYGTNLLRKITSSYSNENYLYSNAIKKMELGSNVKLDSYALGSCYSLKTITIPEATVVTTQTMGQSSFMNCYNLKNLIIPSGVKTIGSGNILGCYSLENISFPKSANAIASSSALGTQVNNLKTLIIPDGNTIINISEMKSLQTLILPNNSTKIIAVSTCSSLKNLTLPSTVTSFDSYAFADNYSLLNIAIPSGISKIPTYTFRNCYSMRYYDFSNHASIPTLANVNAFSNIPSDCKIVVPDNLYNNWIAADKWSTYANNIISKSSWDAL